MSRRLVQCLDLVVHGLGARGSSESAGKNDASRHAQRKAREEERDEREAQAGKARTHCEVSIKHQSLEAPGWLQQHTRHVGMNANSSRQLDTGEPAAAPATIRRLAPSSVHRITSNQVILDLQTAVKELVENALDAHASKIEVRFADHGLAAFEVVDDGTGIRREDWRAVGSKYCTSKLDSWESLQEGNVTTFGFRGEALSSLCALAEQVKVTTATQETSPVGTVLTFAQDGSLLLPDAEAEGEQDEGQLDSLPKAARQRGTTVSVTGLFAKLPVRRREFEKNVKREYAKAQAWLQAYALVSRGVRWSTVNTPKGG